jgi:membrane-associated phospholipid phosphatase
MDANDHNRLLPYLAGPVSRRSAMRGLGGAGLAAALGLAAHRGVLAAETATAASPIEPNAGSWETRVLESGDQFRLPAPDESTTKAELTQLEALVTDRDAEALASIAYWDAGAPAYRWNNLAIQHMLGNGVVGLRAARALSLLNVAITDATIAAWDTKYTYNRPRPATLSPELGTALPTPHSPAYPSEHAVTAGAASAVLGYLFPEEAATFAALAEEAGTSRLLAGTDYPSDVTAGMALGQRVAELAIARAKDDGSAAEWTGSVPTEPGMWNGTKPYEPMGGTWQPWVLDAADQFRPGPPPAPDSAQMAEDLAELKDFERTNLTNLTAAYWEYYGGRASFELYTNYLSQKLFEERLDLNPPRAARAYALMDVAMYDVFVAAWDAKYAYWAIRPFQLDDTVTTVFATPNHPSYPAAHASLGGAMETILGALFPRDADVFTKIADDESWSRLWAGIHFRSDIEAGRVLGRAVGQAVLEHAAGDGAD